MGLGFEVFVGRGVLEVLGDEFEGVDFFGVRALDVVLAKVLGSAAFVVVG